MKVIAIGDPHFKTDNITETNLFIEKLENLVKKENPDLIVVLGDLLHTHERLHTTPLNKAHDFILKLRELSDVVILVGNHDMENNQQFLTTNHWMNGMKEWKNVQIVDKIIHKYINNYHFVFVPYVPPGRFIEALNTDKDEWKNADCIFAHQEFFGCKMGAIISTEGDKWDEKYPNVVSGHIHSRQKIQENIYYCGSSMQNAFGESEKNIIPIFTWEEAHKNYNLQEVDLELPRKKIVYTEIENIQEYKYENNTDDKIKISVSGDYEEFKAFKKTKKYKDIVKTGTKVVFKPKKVDIIEKNEKIDQIKSSDFIEILNSIVNSEDDPYLTRIYELIIKNIV
jgi:DNA repair exonuclease SbcCD nuclease subunit